MNRKSLVVLSVCACLCSTIPAWSQTGYIPDSGSTGDRTCNPRSYTQVSVGPEVTTVRDNVTGLEWVWTGNLINNRDPSFDTDGTPGDGAVTWQTALNYIDKLNSEEYLGYDDWRLPTAKELLTIADFGKNLPAIDLAVFGCVSSAYWSETVAVYNTDRAWQIAFSTVNAWAPPKTNNLYVRPVRGTYSQINDFHNESNGTVFDDASGLTWHPCSYGQTWEGTACTGSALGRTRQQAQEYIDDLNGNLAFGYDDWRLPSLHELHSIVDHSCTNPATTLSGTLGNVYWSSTVYDDSWSWGVDYYYGQVNFYNNSSAYRVRAVRGGPCRADGDWCIDDDDCGAGTPLCDNATDTCVECLVNGDCTDDGLYCTGTTVCTANTCADAGDPCSGGTPVCDEAGDRCVECLTDGDCDAEDRCASNVCIARGSMQITKATVKAGKVRGADSIKFSGTFDATTADVDAAMNGTITLRIEAAGIPDLNETTFTFPINAEAFKKGKYKSPKVKPALKTDPVVGLAFDTVKGKLSFKSKNLSLTGLACPITVRIEFGTYAAVTVLNEDVVNGTKPCPAL